MLLSIVASLSVATPLQALETSAPAAEGAGTTLVVELGPTHLRARNTSFEPRLLLFAQRDAGHAHAAVLAPGAELGETFPRHALEGVRLEVLAQVDGRWTTTGALDLDAAHEVGAETLLVQQDAQASTTWLAVGGVLYRAEPGASLSASTTAATGAAASATGAGENAGNTHVPVITPSDKPKGEGPLPIERRPLPPV